MSALCSAFTDASQLPVTGCRVSFGGGSQISDTGHRAAELWCAICIEARAQAGKDACIAASLSLILTRP